jgi:hypothetical protein
VPSAINRLCLCLGSLLALSVDAGAQQGACFTVVMTNATAGDLGSIRLDKCTETCILVAPLSTTDNDCQVVPLTVEKSESTLPAPAPTAR